MRWASIDKHYQIIDLKESYCITNVASSIQLGIPVSTIKNIWRWHQENGCVELCSISGFPQSQIFGDEWANTEYGFCGSPSAQEWYGADNDVVVTVLVVQCGHSITRCVTKLISNCRHWDQSLYGYHPIISLQGTRVSERRKSPSPIGESARIPFMQTLLTQCPCAHKTPIRTLL